MKKKSKSKLPKKILVKYTKKGNSEASKPSCYDYETLLSSEELFSILNFRENQSSNIGMARPACVKRITATCVKISLTQITQNSVHLSTESKTDKENNEKDTEKDK